MVSDGTVGRTPRKGGETIQTMEYGDRLSEPETFDELMDLTEALAEEVAEEHHEKTHNADICGACITETPVTGDWGPWMDLRRDFEAFAEAVAERVRDLDPDDDALWVHAELWRSYLEAFHDSGVDPEECVVCTRQVISEHDQCGHEILGEECPVQ